MNAKEFYKEYFPKAWQMEDESDKRLGQFDWYDLIDFAESYYQKMKKQ